MTVSHLITNPALRWLEVIFAERFGHAWHLSSNEEGLRLRLAGAESVIVFDKLDDGFTQARSDQPCAWWDATSESWDSVLGGSLPAPGVAKLAAPLIETRAGEHIIHYDIPGLTYWMLARVEEIGRTDLDEHGRFHAKASHAFRHGYLDRPIVDEWLHILRQVIQRQWPGLKLKEHYFEMKVSHDVDVPARYAFCDAKGMLRRMAGDLLKRGDIKTAFLAAWIRTAGAHALRPADPCNTFDWIMDVSESHGMKSAFYFICGRTDPFRDADYEPEHPAIRNLMRRIHARGHEIGLHPSYGTYQVAERIMAEANRLSKVCAEEKIEQAAWGGRMHYLRWEHPTTMWGLDGAGIAYDSTLGYADIPGFRCGTCFEYPAFDPIKSRMLNLRIRPLIAMECSVIKNRYLGLGVTDKAYQEFVRLKRRCRQVSGVFTLLWHNSELTTARSKKLYACVLSA